MSEREQFNEISYIIADAVENVEQGYRDAYALYAELKQVEKTIKEAMSQIEEQVFEEIQDSKVSYHQYEIEKRKGSIRWDFSHIPTIAELKQKIKDVEVMHKLAYDRERKGLEPFVDSETGEFIEAAVAKYTKDSIIVKKKK